MTKATLVCRDPFGECRTVDLLKPLGAVLHRWAPRINFDPILLANKVNLSGYSLARRHKKDLGIIRSVYPKAEARLRFQRKGGKQLDTALRVLGVTEAAKALRPYTGFLLDSWLLDHRERASLYKTLIRLVRIRLSAHRQRAIYRTNLATDLGLQTPRYTSVLKNARLVRHKLLPVKRLDTLRPFPKNPMDYRCTLDLGAAKRAHRAEFGLAVAGLPPFFTLRCFVGRSEVHLYSPADRSESCQIWASFDPRGIEDGPNPVSITILSPAGTGLRRSMDLKEIRIHLLP